MTARRVLVVDDEAPARANLRYALADHPGWQIHGEAANCAQARSVLLTGGVDLVFLDIQMPGESGLELARELAASADPPLIVFVTAYDQHAIAAFEANALDYLLKPFSDERLAHALQRATEMIDLQQRAQYADSIRQMSADAQAQLRGEPVSSRRFIGVKSVGKIERIAVADVRWLEASGNYVALHLAQREVLHRATMAQMTEWLDPLLFIRVHRRALVRRSELRSLHSLGAERWEVALTCGRRVAVGESFLVAVRAELAAR